MKNSDASLIDASVPVKFWFSIPLASSNAALRSAKQT
jgi:hypothetical protein